MTKEKISKVYFQVLVNNFIKKKVIEKGFVFTMIDRSGREWFLDVKELEDCTNESFKEATEESIKQYKALKESFRLESERVVSEKYDIQKFDTDGRPIY